MVMFSRIRTEDFAAGAASFYPSMVFACVTLSLLSLHLDVGVGPFVLIEVSSLSAFAVNFRYLLRHLFGHQRPANPAVMARMEANSLRIDAEEACDPQDLPSLVFVSLSRFSDLLGIQFVAWIVGVEHVFLRCSGLSSLAPMPELIEGHFLSEFSFQNS